MTESIKEIIEWHDSLKPVTAEEVKKMNEETGEGMMDCHFALLQNRHHLMAKNFPIILSALKTCIEALEKISKDNPQSFHENLEIAQEALKSIGWEE